MNENKEIEELAREFCPIVCPNQCNHRCANVGNCQELKEACIKIRDLGYRNVKDKVVLDKEEYQNDFSSQFNKGYEKARKETAREIVKALKNMAYQSNDWSHGEHPMVVEVDYIEEIAEEYGVEVEE